MTGAFLSVGILREKQACPSAILTFEHLFPDGVMVTKELCAAHASLFDWTGAAYLFFSGSVLNTFQLAETSAFEVYDRVRTPSAWEGYRFATASAFGELLNRQEPK